MVTSGKPTKISAVWGEPGQTGGGGDVPQSRSIRTRSAQDGQIVSENDTPRPRQERTRRRRG
jgi:hypothetical protein